jgi:hypothetical protein
LLVGEALMTVGAETDQDEPPSTGRLGRVVSIINNDISVSVVILIFAIVQWGKFLFAVKRIPQDGLNIGIISVSVATPIAAVIYFLKRKSSGWAVAVMFVAALLAVIGAFAWIYWDSGSVNNFSVKLSHLDAVYFALGTLTTGSGNIAATSELSRTIQTIQLVLDLLLMGFAAGIVFGRFAEYIKR